MCESFFATLECELLARRRFASQAEARMAFFSYVETASAHGAISGYSDHTFRWGANATRGQIAKIVATGQ